MEKLFINKVVILDGRPNAVISRKNLKPEDYGGRSKAGCSEILNITRPHLIGSLHLDYLEAGADIIRTNSFGGNEHFLSQFALTHKAQEINRAACRVAKEAARRFSSKGSPRFVAGNIGCDICPHFVPGRFPFSKLVATFFNHALPLLEEGADLLFLEECRHTLTTKAAICGIHEAFAILEKTVPLIVSATVENGGTMAGGQSVEAFYASISHANFLLFGLHSKEGPEALAEPLRKITEISTSRIGMWADLAPVFKKEPQKISTSRFASEIKRVAGTPCPAALGGGEGVTPEHIKKVFELFHKKKPAQAKRARLRLLAGKKLLNIDLETKPIVVGERANISGSRQFRTLVYEEKFGEAADFSRNQIEKGAAMLDICFIGSERGESTDMKAFLEQGLEKLDVPLMIDSLSYTVLEETLQQVCGKSVINSVNLLKGEKSIEGVAALALRYGAAIVAGTIDEKPKGGMALTGEQKVEVAARMFDLLSGKFGVHLSNIIIDPLVFPVISKGKRFIGAAKETIEGLRLIKKHLPGTSTLVGVSNISFGIPGRAGMVLSSVFLHHAQQTGLDFAIANPEKLLVYSSIGGRERELSEDLIFSGGDDPLKNFTSFYSGFGEKLRN